MIKTNNIFAIDYWLVAHDVLIAWRLGIHASLLIKVVSLPVPSGVTNDVSTAFWIGSISIIGKASTPQSVSNTMDS
jgi:hypothetical protein